MSTLSSLTLRSALADSALRESLLISALVFLASGGLVFAVTWLWVLGGALARVRRADIEWLIVCGHLLEPSGRPSPIYRSRLARAALLAEHSPGLRLLLTGGGRPSEAAAGRQWLVQVHGLEPERIQLEEVSTDTFENLRHARTRLPAQVRSGIVTSRFHLARAMCYARHLGMQVLPVPAEARWLPSLGNVTASVREAALLCWFVCGRSWARLARRQELLARIR